MRKILQKHILIFILCICNTLSFGQHVKVIDSLIGLLKNAADTAKITIYKELSWEYRDVDHQKAFDYASKALYLAQNKGITKEICDIFNRFGIINRNEGNYLIALDYFFKVLTVGNLKEAENEIGYANNNIADVYNRLGQFDKAIDFVEKATKIFKKSNNKLGLAYNYNQYGLIYKSHKEYENAIRYFEASLKIRFEINHLNGIATSYLNIGECLLKLKEYDKAFENFTRSLDQYEAIGDKSGIAQCHCMIGEYYSFKMEHTKAIESFTQSMRISVLLNEPTTIKRAAEGLRNIFVLQRNFEQAFYYQSIYIQASDSLAKTELAKSMNQPEMDYLLNQKEVQFDKEKEHKELIYNEEMSRQQSIVIIALVGFVFVLIFAIYVYKNLINKKKANRELIEKNEKITNQKAEIEAQKEEIELQRYEIELQNKKIKTVIQQIKERNTKLTDSINYAQKIQIAVLPTQEYIENILSDFFIFFKPRDIVSGDFYYIKQIKNIIFVAVADCTGHGVPGAFMSMLGITLLNEIVRRPEIKTTDQLLNELRTQVKQSLQQIDENSELDDGMEIAFLAIDKETNILQFSGAGIPTLIVRANTNEEKQLIELKPDLMPIGIYQKEKPFKRTEIKLEPGDQIYLFSDGYFDQLGGNDGNKFLSKNLKSLLLSNSHKSLENQKLVIEKTIDKWSEGYEQVDDMLVIGFRVDK